MSTQQYNPDEPLWTPDGDSAGHPKAAQCTYYFVYRVRFGTRTNRRFWRNPTGGLVVEGDICPGLLSDIAEQRYHCHPDESIWLMEVWRPADVAKAKELHRKWDRSLRDFCELMGV